jgi:hypothetical protein
MFLRSWNRSENSKILKFWKWLRSMHEFERSDTQSTNFGKWLHDIKYTWAPHCEAVPLPPTLVYYSTIPSWACVLLFIASAHLGIRINKSFPFKTVVFHVSIRLKTKLLLSFMVNSSQFSKSLIYTYQNKYEFQQTLIKDTWLTFLCCLLILLRIIWLCSKVWRYISAKKKLTKGRP